MIRDCYGLVLCGGQSARMKTDKCFIDYVGIPQWQRVFQMLSAHCQEVFISCNRDQQNQFSPEYPLIFDDNAFGSHGPFTAILSAFARFPDRDLVIVGCDYPFLSQVDLNNFLISIDPGDIASAFFNEPEDLYEPTLGWYSGQCERILTECFAAEKYSLQHFLRNVGAKKYFPTNSKSIMSIDTPELMRETIEQLNKAYAGYGK